MDRLLTATCPTCGNKFHVGGETDEPPGPEAYQCRCPRCNTDFAVDLAGGVPQAGPTGWAVRADKRE
jgi:endogenous inhibitor of DNA gyrase (YacG/DUF329 family)